MAPRAKRDIQDFILGACVSRNKEHNERTKPTGKRFIYLLDFDNDDEEQSALCVSPGVTALTRTYNAEDAQCRGYINDQTALCRTATKNKTSDSTHRMLRRRGSTVSFTKLLASANEYNLPHGDLELDSDSDPDSDFEFDSNGIFSSPSPPLQTNLLDVIEEASEEEEKAATSIPIADYVFTKVCRDPYFSGHPTCHNRTQSLSYAHTTIDADTDLQQRFTMKHDGEDSAAHYLNWQALKWEYGQSMVHGPSLLRREVPTPVSDPAAQLPLQVHSRAPTRRENRCYVDGVFEGDRFIGDDAEVGVWLVDVDKGEDLVSETSTLFEEVVGTGRDAEADIAEESPAHGVRTLPEEALLKILNTSRDEFVEHYSHVQRQKATRSRSSVAASSQVEASSPTCYVPVGAPCVSVDTAPELAQHLVQTTPPSTPEVSPTHLTDSSYSKLHSHRADTPPATSSSESLSVRPSVFTHTTSLTTKPSTESCGSDQLRPPPSHRQAKSPRGASCSPDAVCAPADHQQITDSVLLSAPRLSRRLKARNATKKCLQTLRGTVQRGVGGVSGRMKKMGEAMRGLCGARVGELGG